MKRDRTGKFIYSWEKESKQAVNLSLTKTAWQILKQEARERGISRSELVERYARTLQSDLSFNNLSSNGKLDACHQAEETQQRADHDLEGLVAERTSELSQANAQLQVQIVELQRTIEALQSRQLDFTPLQPAQAAQQGDAPTANCPGGDREVIHILESITDGFIAYDRDWRYTYVNEAAVRLLKKSRNELIGQRVWDVFPLLCGTNIERMLHKAVDEQTALVFEDYYAPLDTWGEVHAYPSAEGLSLFVRDITERKKLEQLLQQNAQAQASQRQWLEAVLNLLPIPLVFIEPQTARFTFSNQAANEMAGGKIPDNRPAGVYDAEFSCTDATGQLIPPDQLPAVRVARGEKIHGAELNWHTPTGVYSLLVYADTLPAMHELPPTCVMVFQDIGSRKQVELQLHQSQRFIEQVADATPGVLYIYDLIEQRNVYANRQIGEVLGYTLEQIQAMGSQLFSQLMHPEDLATLGTHIQRFHQAHDGEIIEREYRMQHANGEWRWLWSRDLIFTRTHDGLPQQVIGISHDISARKQAEEALRQQAEALENQQKWLEAVLDLMPTPMVFIEPGTAKVTFANRIANELAGGDLPKNKSLEEYPDAYYCTDAAGQRIPTERMPAVLLARGERLENYEMNWHTPGGIRSTLCWGETLPPMYGHSAVCIGMFQDVTKLKQIEENLRQTEERLQLALSGTGTIAWDMDLRANHVLCSPNALEVWGIQEGTGEDFFAVVHSEERQSVIEAYERALAGEEDYAQEYRVIGPDGTTTWLRSQGRVYKDADGPVRMVGVSIDISARKQTEQALAANAQRLSLALAAAKMGDWSWDAATDIVTFSQRAAEIFGIPSGPYMTWTHMRDLLHHEDREQARLAVEQAIRHERDYDIEYRVIHANGAERWVAAKGRAQYSVSGDVLSMLGVVQDVSDRKQMEAELRRREQRFKTLAENSPDIISRIDSEFRHIYVSPAIEQVTGIPAEEFIGKTNIDLGMPPESCRLWHENWQQIFTTGQSRSIEFNFEALNGTRWYQSRFVPEFAADGTVESIIGYARDVTELKRVEQQERFLAQASQTFAAASLDLQTVLNTITRLVSEYTGDVCVLSLLSLDGQWLEPVSVYHVDPQVRQFVNELLSSYPRRVDEGIGGQVMQTGEALLMPVTSQEELRAVIKPEYQRYLERFKVYSTLLVPLKVRGQAIGVLSLTRNHPGEPHNTNDQTLFQNLADRAAMAIANAQLYQQAQLSRQQAEQTADRNARLLSVTAALSESLTPPQVAKVIVEQSTAVLNACSAMMAILNKNGTELEIVYSVGYPQDIGEWRCFPITTQVPLAEAVRTGEPIWEESTEARVARYPHLAEYYAQCNYASWISLPLMVEGRAVGGISLNFTQFSPLSDDDRAFILALAQQCAQAIVRAQLYEAEQQALAAAVREAARSAAANRTKDEFLAVLSHELRTPMNPILGWTKLLREGKLNASKTAAALETIERNAKLQVQLIEDLLNISRILQGKLSLNTCPVNLESTIEAALKTVDLAAQAKAIQIQTHFESDVGNVLGDATRLQQVIWNLLSNAIKFTPNGGRVEIHLKQVEKQAQIVVSDTGKGINPDFLPYVFDYFRQADSSITRTFGGLGLGLAIARHIVELHGGTIQAESPGEGQGATFTVRLPLIPTPTLAIGEEAFMQDALTLQGIQILAVDDDADNLELITFVLEQAGASVISVSSATEALQRLKQTQFDILLADIAMPEMDGYTLLRFLRGMPPEQGGAIPAIALTAYAGEINQQQAITAGFQLHIPKPIDPEVLIEAIAQIVSTHSTILSDECK
ncbi:MAG: PAS domain S-box protein [Scytonema hyalinum WJT4-NPBG1]|jgi:PAS domain S-box-containing protein|nr:PAS domain S-box protein [Scytonema hyalinum WJT4-NPBG1]